MAKQATWAKNTNEPREAAKMYLAAGENLKALEIIGNHGWTDMYVEMRQIGIKNDCVMGSNPAVLTMSST